MTRTVWSDVAEASLLELPPSEAMGIFEAVEKMVTLRRGFVRDMLDGTGTLGLSEPQSE
jgi:hypothetical protein